MQTRLSAQLGPYSELHRATASPHSSTSHLHTASSQCSNIAARCRVKVTSSPHNVRPCAAITADYSFTLGPSCPVRMLHKAGEHRAHACHISPATHFYTWGNTCPYSNLLIHGATCIERAFFVLGNYPCVAAGPGQAVEHRWRIQPRASHSHPSDVGLKTQLSTQPYTIPTCPNSAILLALARKSLTLALKTMSATTCRAHEPLVSETLCSRHQQSWAPVGHDLGVGVR